MKEEILRMEHVFVKRRGRYALHDFKLNVYKGEVVVAFGFSGSGIHELGQVLSGARLQSGRILLNEKEINWKKYFYPERLGIYVIYNENNLVPDLTVAENLFLGEQKHIFSLVVSEKKQEKLAESILAKFQLQLDAKQRARELAYYQQIMVKLVKAYAKGAKLVVINEILELANSKEREAFIRIINVLKQDGISILWINQRMEFVKDLADRVVVIRDGKNVKTFYGREYPMELLMRTVGDSKIEESTKRTEGVPGATILQVDMLTSKYLKDITLQVKQGQIVGIWSNDPFSLMDFCTALRGELSDYQGSLTFKNRVFRPRNHEEAVAAGVQYIDFMWREKYYLPDMSIIDNQMLGSYWKQKKRYSVRNKKWVRYMELRYRQRHPKWARGKWRQLTPDQQTILLYERCLDWPGKIVLVSEPFTRVNDRLASEIIHIFREMQQKDKTLLLLSMNFADLSKVCEEIYLIQDKRLVRKVESREFQNLNIWDYVS